MIFKEAFNLKEKICLSYSSTSFFLYAVRKNKNKNLVYLSDNYKNLVRLKNEIESIDSEVRVAILTEFDCSFFSNLSPTRDTLSKRAEVFYNLTFGKNTQTIFLISLSSIVQKTIPIQEVLKRRLIVSNKDKNVFDTIINFLKANMYEKVEFVRNKGEYAIRGDILDVFSPNEINPVRISFEFNDIESMYLFDLENQKSIKEIDKYNLFMASEILFNDMTIQNFRQIFRKIKINDKEEYYKSISEHILLPGSEQFYPILFNKFDSIINYFTDSLIFIQSEFFSKYLDEFNKFLYEFDTINNLISKESDFLQTKEELNKILDNKKVFTLYNYSINDSQYFNFSDDKLFSNNKIKNLNSISKIQKKNKIIFCTQSKINKKKISIFLNNKGIKFLEVDNLKIQDIGKNKDIFFIFNLSIQSSFSIKLKNFEIIFLSDIEFFNKVTKKITKKKNDENLIHEFSQLSLGDLVVHMDHGIGKFNGIRNNDINGFSQDFIELLYHNNDKLLIPIENLELITRYGSDEKNITLDKLGLQNWQNRKAIIKKKIQDIAYELVKTAAKRKLIKGEKIVHNKLEYEKFSSLFEFTETSDQIKAIEQIENDFLSGSPMDRLVCGDVGFGKTEIAMRAAFLAISAGFQVAMICPKVLLVNQHYETFNKRFRNFNYNISKISRLESYENKKRIKENISSGLIDIVIGSHALLSDEIKFKNLGLIIVDEEQSFGVQQKEKLKKIKPNTHILTLSATPIPRTLQSSFLKIRQISLIKTPPINRINVKTFLTIYDDQFLKKIIKNEIDRKGQVYFVTPKISDQNIIKKKILKIFPNLKFAIINGKLNPKDLENIYNDFFNKKIDLLISTAMIESGLDNSNVNTIIIDKPYLFGLAQLYQLRGRVGRSSVQAFAYLMLEKNLKINDERLNRLKIISQISSLGSGFSIATHDLDMRGGGNIIGSEQSGHIREVGIELYYKMLNETINKIKNENIEQDEWSPSIKLGFSFNIPNNYISNIDTRINIYRKISNITENANLLEIVDDLKDRYGKLPESFENLFKIIEIKILSKKNGITKIDDCHEGYVLEFKENEINYIDKLIELAKLHPKKIKLLPKSKMMYVTIVKNKLEKISELKKFLKLLVGLKNER